MYQNNDTLTRLDQEWIFIINIIKDTINAFEDNPVQNKIAKSWIHKLSSDLFLTYHDKINRNSLLCGLASCLQSKKLTGFYKKYPTEPLPSFQLPPIRSQEWLDSLIETNQNTPSMLNTAGGKDCRTFVSSKELDRGRGSMAYIALSVTDEGENPWTTLSESFDPYFSKTKRNLEKRSPEMTVLIYRQLVQLIDESLSGRVKPQSSYVLETILKTFIDSHRTEPRIRLLFKTRCDNQRSMLLQLLKAELMHYIIQHDVGIDLLKPDIERNDQINDEVVNAESDLALMLNGVKRTSNSKLLLHERAMLQRAASYRNSLKHIENILNDNDGMNMEKKELQDKFERTLKAAEYSGVKNYK